MSLIDHATAEIKRAGLDAPDADYDGMIGKAVLELVEVFSRQGHSGMSAQMTISLFAEVAQFHALTPLTDDPAEWNDVSEASGPMWQSRRNPEAFSQDGGQTYRLLGDQSTLHVSEPAG